MSALQRSVIQIKIVAFGFELIGSYLKSSMTKHDKKNGELRHDAAELALAEIRK
jgi:hypothetical protein